MRPLPRGRCVACACSRRRMGATRRACGCSHRQCGRCAACVRVLPSPACALRGVRARACAPRLAGFPPVSSRRMRPPGRQGRRSLGSFARLGQRPRPGMHTVGFESRTRRWFSVTPKQSAAGEAGQAWAGSPFVSAPPRPRGFDVELSVVSPAGLEGTDRLLRGHLRSRGVGSLLLLSL